LVSPVTSMTAVIMPSLSLGRLVDALTSFARRTLVADRPGGHVCRAAWQRAGRPSGRAASTVRLTPESARFMSSGAYCSLASCCGAVTRRRESGLSSLWPRPYQFIRCECPIQAGWNDMAGTSTPYKRSGRGEAGQGHWPQLATAMFRERSSIRGPRTPVHDRLQSPGAATTASP
jgi:hypothetical protein